MIETIRTREQLEQVIARGVGYLYNDFGGRDPKQCPVHSVRCTSLARMTQVKPGTLGVKKLWSESLEELVTEVIARGKVFVFCGNEPELAARARGGTHDTGRSSHAPAASPPLPRARGAAPPPTSSASANGHYHVTVADSSRGPVCCGSTERLNFEPKDWRLSMRDELRSAVRGLRASGHELLHAVFASHSGEAVDAENVLFYNIGMGSFGPASGRGVRFERIHSTAPLREGAGDWPHQMRYTVSATSRSFEYWTPGHVLAEWSGSPSPPLGEDTKPGEVWLALKRHGFDTHGLLTPPTASFGMRIRVRRGANGPTGATAMLKALIDGVVSALHVHDGRDLDEVARRLERMLGAPAAELRTHLMDPDTAVLGTRDLLWLRGANVQWNPADDGLVAAEVRIEEEPAAGGRWSHSGELFTVSERDAG